MTPFFGPAALTTGFKIVSFKAAFQELRELHADTEEKLNILIDTVDRIIRRDNPPREPNA